MKQIVLIESVTVITGTVIGAGVLGLPFAFARAGFFTALLILILISFCMTMAGLFWGEIALRTKETHQLSGYADLYLGKTAKHVQGLTLLLGMYGALLAYTIGLGDILNAAFGGSELLWSLLIYVVLSVLAFKGIQVLQRATLFTSLFIALSITALIVLAASNANISNLMSFDLSKLFLPYGAILFACSGLMAIPEAREVLAEQKQEGLLKRTIIIGNLIPAVIYLLFVMAVVGVTGIATTDIATIGLSESMGSAALILGSIFAFFAMSSGFLALGTALTEVCEYDYKLNKLESALISFAPPFILFIFGIRDFFAVISIAGAFSVGLSGILSVLVYWQAKKQGQRKPEFSLPNSLTIPASVLITLVFALGLLYTLSDLFA